MNAHFGGLLKQELSKIMQASDTLRTRSHSTGSARLSSDSTESSSGNRVDTQEILADLVEDGYATTKTI